MRIRAGWRGLVLFMVIVVSSVRYGWIWARCKVERRAVRELERAQWMSDGCRLLTRALGIRVRVEVERGAKLPAGPVLIASNHLSYLDIAIFAAASPCAFVAKQEIAAWPIFGQLGRLGGTIFVDRESRISAWKTVEAMEERLSQGVPVLFFPEGTSSDGREVLSFHSPLFAAAAADGFTIVPAAIRYECAGEGKGRGLQERDLCWYGDEAFLPHLMRVMHAAGFVATVRFGRAQPAPDRKVACWRSLDAVGAMREAGFSRSRKGVFVESAGT